jgi:uncharacterized lipoprotein
MAARCWMAAVLAVSVLGGCSRDHTLTCEAAQRYARASSAPPVRIPDGLTAPDESDSLRVPPESVVPSRSDDQPCLEAPPAFSGRNPPSTAPAAPRPASEPAPNPDREIDD